jgi:acetyl-CoA acyltransferase 1
MRTKSKDDIVIVGAWRTPFGRAGRGSFSDLSSDYLLYSAIKGSLKRLLLSPADIDEIILGNVLSPVNGTIEARAAALRSGIPLETPVMTINRQCGSGLESLAMLALKISSDQIKIGMGGGFEFMTRNKLPTQYDLSNEVKDDSNARGCLLSMGMTCEIMAERFHITRQEADSYACESQARALDARRKGLLANEIVPVLAGKRMIAEDDGIRETTIDGLGGLTPCFREGGVSTAGNSSQLSDGASIVIMMKRKTAIEKKLNVLGVFVDYRVVGVEPCVMGIGPSKAIPLLLEVNELKIEDVEAFEVNEAFSAQSVYCMKKLGIPHEKYNLNGGAIAYGHPLGCTGSKLVCTLLNILERKPGSYGVVSLCVGTGMGVAALLYRE